MPDIDSNPQMPIVTVVIPAYMRTAKLADAIRSVLVQDIAPDEYEIVVVDSSPDDSNFRLVESLQAEAQCSLRCLRKQPEGPGPSRNLGANSGRGSFLAFMDSDCKASPGWIRSGLSGFSLSRVGLVQGKTMPEPGAPHSVFNWYIQIEEESFLYETANIFYRRQAFEEAGGFLGDMRPTAEKPVGGEDVDLAWKVKRAGWESRFVGEALVFHEVVRMRLLRWFVNHRLYICPKFVRDYPELRQFFVYGYFYEQTQVWVFLALLGALLAPITLWALVLALPYVIARGSESSRTLKGPLRLLRVALYAPRDCASFVVLIAGSLRYGALLL
jgi:cellulose synthase/poly-beta-1,6-N-acetylglucosamine synthase-like glycosyltransferase